jgi:ribonuclease HI
VARDNTGNVLGARVVSKHVVAAPKVAESMAALEAVLFSKVAGFMEVILEGDANQVVEDVNSASLNLNAAGHFVDEIKEEILGLRHASVIHVGREAKPIV